MPDYRSRMVGELYELDSRIQKLYEFTDTQRYERIEPADQMALLDQLQFMIQYRRVLSARIAKAFSFDAE